MARKIVKNIELNKVFFDIEVYPREIVNWQTVFDYANSLKAGAKFPPITLALHRGKFLLVDGKHRLDAFKQCKKKTIPAEIYSGWNKKKIFLESIQRNISHGKVLSPYEKRKCIMKLREMKVSNKDISSLIQIPQDKIENFVGQRLISSTTGDNIDLSIIKSGIKHIAGRSYNVKDIKAISSVQKEIYVHKQIDLFDHLINLFENNLVDMDDKKIQNRILRLSGILAGLIMKAR